MSKYPKYKYWLAEMIQMWLRLNEDLREVNHQLYTHTELFENGYESNFDEELHNFFAKKITRFNKDRNELYKILPDNIREILRELERSKN